MSRPAFQTDIDFCTDCGAILPLPGLEDVVKCRVCDHEIDVKEFDGVRVSTSIIFNSEGNKLKKTKVDIPAGPMVDRKCPKCYHEGMTYATVQLRSADEGQTVFYSCPHCKFQEMENS